MFSDDRLGRYFDKCLSKTEQVYKIYSRVSTVALLILVGS